MNEFESVLDYQVRSMLEAIAADLARRREAIHAEAREEARDLLKRVRRDSLSRMRAAVDEERGLYEERIQQVRAALATRRRQQRQQRERVALDAARALLREALERRWQGAETRREWMEAAIHEAAAVLEQGSWTVRHPTGLPDPEIQWLESLVRGFTGRLELLPDDEMACGLAVECGGAVVDMSVDGLLGQAEEIDGRLLAALYHEAEADNKARPAADSGDPGAGETSPARGEHTAHPVSKPSEGTAGAGTGRLGRSRKMTSASPPGGVSSGDPGDVEEGGGATRTAAEGGKATAGAGTQRSERSRSGRSASPGGTVSSVDLGNGRKAGGELHGGASEPPGRAPAADTAGATNGAAADTPAAPAIRPGDPRQPAPAGMENPHG